MTTLQSAVGQSFTVLVIWGIGQLLPRGPLRGGKGLRYVMWLAIGFAIADLLAAVTLHKPLYLTDIVGLVGLVLVAVAVILGTSRIDRSNYGGG